MKKYLVFLYIIIYSCENKPDTNNEFVYKKNNKKIELILENNVNFLVVDQPTKTKFKTKNIDNQKLMVYGPGIMVNRESKDDFRFTITPIKETLVNGNLEIQITERIENGENFTHKFLVPVKTKIE